MKIAKNTFEGGINTDASVRTIAPNQYVNGVNVSLTSHDGFGVLTPIAGSTFINDLGVYTNIKIIGQFDTMYLYNGVEKACVTLVAILDSHYVIWCCPSDGSTPVKIYDKVISNPDDYTAVSGQVYSENGVDYLYFTDAVDQPKQLRCVIPNSGSFTLLTDNELSILRRAPLGTSISDFTVNTTGGSLLCGSYLACVRLYNSVNNRYSAWTLLTNPIKITQGSSSNTELSNSARGAATTKSITFTVSFNNATEKALYTHYQLGVVENTSSDSPNLFLSVLAVDPLPVGSSTTFTYAQNQKTASISIDEVVVEPAPVETAKTLTIKDNRLFLGNITYKDLDYDNGTPEFSNTSSVTTFAPDPLTTNTNWYVNDNYASKNVGYFRDELYRFAISYWDDNYNFSPPSVLDMEVIGNQLGAGDMKFPSRLTSGYSLFNSSGMPQALGLSLNSLTNHPSWARGFVILKARRQKNILFQTPFIPAVKVEPASAFNKYPIEATQSIPTVAGGRLRTTVSFPDAQPGVNTLGTYVPKNLFQGVALNIIKKSASQASGTQVAGQVQYVSNNAPSIWTLFPTGDMYQSPSGSKIGSYSYATGDKYRGIDIALFKLNYTDSSDNDLSFNVGDFVNTQIEGRFYSDTRDLYYSSNISGTSSGFPSIGNPIKDYVFLDTFDAGKSLDTGEPLEQYADILPTGFTDGFVPTPLRKGYIRPVISIVDVVRDMYDATKAGPGSLSGVNAGSIFVNGTRLESDYLFGGNGGSMGYGNKFIIAATGFTNDNLAQGIHIVNIERGLGDDRYGTHDTFQEFISTGTMYEFSDSEVNQLRSGSNIITNVSGIAVWGGDCYLPYVQYKFSDTTFSISDDRNSTINNPQTSNTVADKFLYSFDANGDDMVRPVPLKAASQLVSCFIESEFHLDALTRSGIYNTGILSNNIVKISSTSKEQYRLPLSYVVQPELSFQNDYKVWVPKLTDIVSPTEFRSRILVSDQKVYQSDVKGFDTFKVLSFYDLDETYGDITSLLVSENRMYAIQESAIVYVPVNVAQIETADGATLSVTTDAVIGKPIYITNKYGGQSVEGVCLGASGFYVTDQIRGKIFEVARDSLSAITDSGVSRKFESLLSPSKRASLSYDLKKRQLHVGVQIDGNEYDRYIYDSLAGKFITRLSTSSAEYPFTLQKNLYLSGGMSSDKFIVFGQNSLFNGGELSYVSWATGATNNHLEFILVPSVTFIVNPEVDVPKVFEVALINSTDKLDNMSFTVTRDQDFITQTALNIPITDSRYESNYHVVVTRDANGERLRGAVVNVSLFWPLGSTVTVANSKLASVLMKYRPSKPQY